MTLKNKIEEEKYFKWYVLNNQYKDVHEHCNQAYLQEATQGGEAYLCWGEEEPNQYLKDPGEVC